MKWMYLVVAAALLIGVILGLIIGRNRRNRFSKRQTEVRQHAMKYAVLAFIIFEAFLSVLYAFNIVILFYWLTLGPIFVSALVVFIFDLIHRAYLPENARLSGNGWAWAFIVIGLLLLIPTILKLFKGEFSLNEFIYLFLATVLLADGIGRFQLAKV